MKLAGLGHRHPHVAYVPLDLKTDHLEDALGGAGFMRRLRTLFLWEGVTNYLDETSVDTTLRLVARAGSALVFTYVDRAVLDGSASFEGARESIDYVRRLDEPFTFGFDPPMLTAYLRERGLEPVEDRSLDSVAETYYGPHRLKVSAYYHVVRARCLG